MLERDHVAQLGSLDRGSAEASAPENSLLVARNREVDERGASRKRPGRKEDARLAVLHGPDVAVATDANVIKSMALMSVIDLSIDVPAPTAEALAHGNATPGIVDLSIDVPTPTASGGYAEVSATPGLIDMTISVKAPIYVEVGSIPLPGPGKPPPIIITLPTAVSLAGFPAEVTRTQIVNFKLVYCTSAGEGDDFFQPNFLSMTLRDFAGAWSDHVDGSNDRSISLEDYDFGSGVFGAPIPFHMRKVQVLTHDPEASTITLDTVTGVPLDDYYVGWELFLRSPRLGDEMRKGYNVNAETPLYNKLKPAATVTAYDATTGVFTLDQVIPWLFDTDVKEAERYVDLMLPDRGGLPVIRWNLYASFYESTDSATFNGTDWYLVTQGDTHGVWSGSVVPLNLVTGTPNAPSGRVTRTAPTVAVSETTEVLHYNGAMVKAPSGIVGGEWDVRYCWETQHEDILLDDGWVPIRDEFFIGAKRPRVIASQKTWPSSRALARIKTGQTLDVTLPTFPDGVHKAHVYAKKNTPDHTITLKTGSSQAYTKSWNSGSFTPPDPMTDSPSVKRASLGVDYKTWASAGGLGTGSTVVLDGVFSPFGVVLSGGPFPVYRSQIAGAGNFLLDFDLSGVTASDISTVSLKMTAKVARVDNRFDTNPYDPSANYEIRFRRWDETAGTWTTIHSVTEFKAKTTIADSTFQSDGTYQSHVSIDAGTEGAPFTVNIPWEFDETDLDGTLQVVDVVFLKDGVIGQCGVGIEFDQLVLEVYTNLTDAGPDNRTYWQGSTEDTTMSFNKPLVVYGGDVIPEATSHQWPITVFGRPVSDSDGKVQKYEDYAAACDSVFYKRHSTLRRIYQEESDCWGKICENKWRFAAPPATGRVFFCNDGRSSGNLFFDGASTFPMGFDDPPVDKGTFSTSTDGDVLDSFESEYWWCYKRIVTVPGRTYIDRSQLVRYTPPALVNPPDDPEDPDENARNELWELVLAGDLPVPHWATHIEMYRSYEGGTVPALSFEIPLNESGLRVFGKVDEQANLTLKYVDTNRDFDLTLPGNFFSGKPPAARFMTYALGRIWFVQQGERELVSWTNSSAISGQPAYAEFYPTNTLDPEMPRAAEISALIPYAGRVLAHSLTGIVPVIIGTGGTPQVGTAFASEGAIGPDAWAVDDKALWYWAKSGPHIYVGTESAYAGGMVKEIAASISQSPIGRHLVDLAVYTAGGRRQLVCGYTEKAGQIADKWLVLDLRTAPINGTGETIWSEWTEMGSYGIGITENHNGDERLLIGDQFGAVHIHDTDLSDNGRFINWRCLTKAFDIYKSSRSGKPRFLKLKLNGRTGDLVLLNVNYDYFKDPANTRPAKIPINVSKFKLWGQASWGDGTTWGEETGSRYYGDQRSSLPSVAQQVQVDIFQTWESMPPGTPRDSQVQCAGFYLSTEARSNRKAKVS